MNKGVIAVVVLFFGFWLFTDAAGFAGAAEGATGWVWDLGQQFFSSVIDFINAL